MQKIVILTGAGISAESGLGTFRDAGGIWAQYDLQELATPEGFAQDPTRVHEFYNARRANAVAASPNAAHRALAELARHAALEVTVVTQNVDDLHERGGLQAVIHMHGELMRALCQFCGARWEAPARMEPSDLCPTCGRPGTRPDVVWFGEIPYHMERIAGAIAQADLFVSIGTSGEVYPAAGFVEEARAYGARTLEINLEPSCIPGLFDRVIAGPATRTVPAWVAELTR